MVACFVHHNIGLQVTGLISSTDALAVTEHGQFCRSPEACKVTWPLLVLRQACLGRLGADIAATGPAPCGRSALFRHVCPLHCTCLVQVWTRGRVALLGDAAHLATQFLAQVSCGIRDQVNRTQQLYRPLPSCCCRCRHPLLLLLLPTLLHHML